jgi:uncharacterized protein YndB with AHSA1/START domain
MSRNLVSKASISIEAPKQVVWQALTTPEALKQYMFGADVTSDWEKGSPITWKGEVNGKKFQDRGVVLEVEPERSLQYTHFSPLSGKPDEPENYHTVTIGLADNADDTVVSLVQDGNSDEAARAESEKNWTLMLAGLKDYVEHASVDPNREAH